VIVRENVRQIEDYLQAADIGLFTSESEGFCLSILEAMCFACPSIASQVGGIPEVVENKIKGLLVPFGDTEKMALAAEDLIQNPARRETLGCAAQLRAQTHFSAKIIVPRYLGRCPRSRRRKQPDHQYGKSFRRFLRSDPLLFGIVNVKKVIDVMSQMGRHKLRNVIFHKFLDGIRHLGQALVAPIIIPLDDFYSRSRFRLSFNPFCDLFVRGAGGDAILELVGRDFRKTKKEVVERAVEVILTGNPRERCPALVQRTGSDDIASHGLPRASREVLGKVLREILYFVCIHSAYNS
jgi:hypothetical protein